MNYRIMYYSKLASENPNKRASVEVCSDTHRATQAPPPNPLEGGFSPTPLKLMTYMFLFSAKCVGPQCVGNWIAKL